MHMIQRDNSSGSDAADVIVARKCRELAGQGMAIARIYTMEMIDTLFGSEEKDRVVAILVGLLAIINPRVTMSQSNFLYGQECIKFIGSLASYSYTLKAWRRDVYDWLMDTSFFRMPISLVAVWRKIILNLCTYDKTVLSEILEQAKLSGAGGGLGLFTSHRQEMEQRSHIVKCIAFTVYCGEKDTYANLVAAIMERVVDSIKLSDAQYIHAQAFLLLRVLLLRLSESYLSPWWPTVITEVIRVFDVTLQKLDQHDALSDADQSLLLSVCKFVDLIVALPIEHFELHQWMFLDERVSEDISIGADGLPPSIFLSYMQRLGNAVGATNDSSYCVSDLPGHRMPLITFPSIERVSQLGMFFRCVSDYTYLANLAHASPHFDDISTVIDTE
eukprot:Ihof_evm1s354 gene=Ihof_evmTU1s354